MKKSALQRVRAEYQPKLPKDLQGDVKVKFGEATESVANQAEIKERFPTHTECLSFSSRTMTSLSEWKSRLM